MQMDVNAHILLQIDKIAAAVDRIEHPRLLMFQCRDINDRTKSRQIQLATIPPLETIIRLERSQSNQKTWTAIRIKAIRIQDGSAWTALLDYEEIQDQENGYP